jgi:hypothetical protein
MVRLAEQQLEARPLMHVVYINVRLLYTTISWVHKPQTRILQCREPSFVALLAR